MQLRWLEKADGTKVLQECLGVIPDPHLVVNGPSSFSSYWRDIPTVKEEKKPREWVVRADTHTIYNHYCDHCRGRGAYVRVREVLEDE